MNIENAKVAMLLDFDPLVTGFDNSEQDSHKAFSLKKLLEYIQQNYGTVVYRKALADWNSPKFRKYTLECMRNGIEMQHVVRSGYNAKNTAAGFMIVQTMACIANNPDITTVILGTCDAEFLSLISYLHSTGRTVIGLGTEGTIAGVLMNNCDEYLVFGSDGLRKVTPAAQDTRPAIRLIKAFLDGGSAYIDELEEELADKLPDFNAEDYGYSDLADFLSHLPNILHLDNTDDGIQVTWIGQPPQGRAPRYQPREFPHEMPTTPLDEYMRQTRWYIQDGPTREQVLTNIYNALATTEGRVASNEELRRETTAELPVDDKAWQGTIYSLVCGGCLWGNGDNTTLSLHKNITSIDEFRLGYYNSLFHKAYNERPDLTPEVISQLMHPEDPETYRPLFEQVFNFLGTPRR
ncbi:MAG: NYN domain-containing protein [Victivallales bacterium]|nr:NYN domain-containing protein [Victivallales bacterium]